MIRALAALAAVSLGTPSLPTVPDLMPVPASISWGQGRLPIDSSFRVAIAGYRDLRLSHAAERLASRITSQTGIPLERKAGAEATATLVIECKGPGETVQSPREDESYRLDVTPKQARIVASTPVGILHGIETFLQLISFQASGFAVPAVRIEDKPRFAWRGLMIDASRHFMPVEVIERNLDAMAAVKLNVFHWHLSDDQGVRVESRRYPKLQRLSSDGLYYTQAEIRRIVGYARERGIRVVPEFDMPGHTTAWFAAYPELASMPGPYKIEPTFGVLTACMDPSREAVYTFLDGFIGEMASLFPDEYFHTGGDEVNGKDWDRSARIRRFKRLHGFKNNEALQAYFSKRVHAIVMKHGKKVIGWDEILDPALPKSSVVHAWRNRKVLADAASRGYKVILSSGYYLDLMQPASMHYAVDPLGDASAGLSEAEQSRILGGEACQWAELINRDLVDFRIWPRMAAIAERFWSPGNVTDVSSMYRRLESVSIRLQYLGMKHLSIREPMLDRIAGGRPSGALRILSQALEPVKGYARDAGHAYTVSSPLNRMVDATPAESDTAREFSAAVDALLAGDTAQGAAVRKQLADWRGQHEALKPVFAASYLAAEVEPISSDVSALAAAGLEALDALASGRAPAAGWAEGQKELLWRAHTHRAELIIVILDPVRKLIEAAGALEAK